MKRLIRNLVRFSQYKDFKDHKIFKGAAQRYTDTLSTPHQYNQSSDYRSNNYQNSQNLIEPGIEVKNYNLTISLLNFNVSMYLIPLSIIRKGPSVLQIKKASSVLGMLFIPKTGSQESINWTARKSFNFKLLDIGKFLYVEPGQGRSTIITNVSQYKSNSRPLGNNSKELSIKDSTQSQTIKITMKQFPSERSSADIEPIVECSISYEQYKLFYQLIRCSLFEISGWKLQMDLHKRQLMKKLFETKIDETQLDNFQNKFR